MPPPLPLVEDFACILHKCRKERNKVQALRLHDAYMCHSGLEADTLLGNHLVSLLVEVGSMCHAQNVFDRMAYRDEHSWNLLITGYVKSGESQHALFLYEDMRKDGSLHLSGYTFVCLLNACATLKDMERGHELHADITRKELLKIDIFVGSALVDMYAKCGSLVKAQEVFDKLPSRDVVSWTVLIAGYAKHGFGEEALKCIEKMQHEGISPNSYTLVCSLKVCGGIGATVKGREVHAEITRKGLERELLVGNTLVDMYARCGLLATAQAVFDKLPIQNVVSWNALVTGYVERGCGQEALYCFEQMQQKGISHDAVTLVCILKACGSLGATVEGWEVHAEIYKTGLEKDLLIGNTLVDMYAKFGLLATAQDVFDKLPVRDVISWNALLTGYMEHGRGEEVLDCFKQMQLGGLSLDAVTCLCILKACSGIGATDKGQEIHADIARKGLEREICIGNTLVDMYAKCDLLVTAQYVFDKLPVRDVISWTALIAGYVEHGHGEEALNCVKWMQNEGVSPNSFTLVCSLKACGSRGDTDKGREVHADIARKGLEREHLVGNTLVDMYAKCGSLAEAQEVFDKLLVIEVASWTALIAGYAEHGHAKKALNCFKQMHDKGIPPDAVTLVCILKACGSIGSIDKGQEIHAEIVRRGLERDLLVGNILVDMYAKYGLLAEAQEVFDELSVQELVSWSALITGYAEHGCGEEAISCFDKMHHEGISCDAVTLVCSLKACGSVGAANKGRELHVEIATKGLEREFLVGNILVDMYGKCGLLAEAQDVFDKIPVQDLVSWNALIAAYAQLGESKCVFYSFDRMVGGGVKPDLVTFISVLNTCNHGGLVDKGQMYFDAISNEYGLIPTLEHYTCMVDLLGRAGHIDKAVAMISKMPLHPDIVLWHTVLGACRKWGNVELGRHAFEHAVQLDEKHVAAYVCMSNIYADSAMQVEADKVEAMRVENQAWKLGHCWWRNAGGVVHSFLGEGKTHLRKENSYVKLEDLSLKVSWDISNDVMEDVLVAQ